MEVGMPEQRIGKTYRAAAGAHREIEWFALICATEPEVIHSIIGTLGLQAKERIEPGIRYLGGNPHSTVSAP